MIFSFDFYAVAYWKKTITKLILLSDVADGRHFDYNSAHNGMCDLFEILCEGAKTGHNDG